jgi:protoporphyrinogen/coproporphyrinogen III oxidase
MKRVAIVGGGITGLATALHLQDGARRVPGGLDVVVLESGSRPGGNIRTDRVDGFTIEAGPNGFLDNVPATLELVRRLGLEDRLQRSDESAARRFLYRNGRLHLLPGGPVSFLRSPVLSLRGRIRVLAEPFARPRPHGVDESVYDFAARRIGPEAASVLVDAMVSGVFAGDVRSLSLQSAFPKMARMEAEHGGLVRAMVAGMKARRRARSESGAGPGSGGGGGPAGPGGTLTSFQDGLDGLVTGLVDAVGGAVRTDARVTAIERGPAGGRSWRLTVEGGEPVDADAVVVAVASPRASPLLEPVDPQLGEAVASIPTAGLAVVALGYRAGDIPELDGFGFLVPRETGPRILGCLWDSSIFPGRAPEGHALLRVMIGGAHDPAAVTMDEGALLDAVRADLDRTMGVRADPVLARIYRWPLGIAQYRVGHQDRLDRIHGRLENAPGLWVAGSSFYGVAMNSCFEKAPGQAAEILEYLGG